MSLRRYFAHLRLLSLASVFSLSVFLALPLSASAHTQPSQKGFYQQTNLVSDISGMAQLQDTDLVNPWGITFDPTNGIRVADNGMGVSTAYNVMSSPPVKGSQIIIPPPKGSSATAAPTGIVFNNTDSFKVSEGNKTGPAVFLFATEDGTISGWNPNVDPTHAILEVDCSKVKDGAVYKGLAMGRNEHGNVLFATNFRFGKVEEFDKQFKLVKSFTDHSIPTGFAPFGIRNIDGKLFVTYAKQDEAKHDDVRGMGNGFVDIFNTDGHLLRRFASRGTLNSPWGLALAPDDFGPFSHDLLVGNFGDGTLNAFDLAGNFKGQLNDQNRNPIVIDGLWGLIFGNDGQGGDPHTLFFTSGPNGESDGLFGSLKFVEKDN